MKSIKMTKEIIKMNIDRKFKIKMLCLGWLECIVNCYKLLIKIPIYIIGLIYKVLGVICEGVLDFCMNILNLIENIPDITFVNQKDKKQLIEIIKKQNEKVYKVQ